jgi:hypothetical protein
MSLSGSYLIPPGLALKPVDYSPTPNTVNEFPFVEWKRRYIEFFPDGRFFTAQLPPPGDEPVLQSRNWGSQSREFPNHCGWYQWQRETILLEFISGVKARLPRSVMDQRNRLA